MTEDRMHGPIALVVEDHVAVREALCHRIKASFGQYRLREAGTVMDALRIIEAESVDVVLMDIRLPGVDGIEGTRAVLAKSPTTSVVVVSTFDDSAHRVAARNAGARGYVCKRAINKELLAVLEGVMTHRQR